MILRKTLLGVGILLMLSCSAYPQDSFYDKIPLRQLRKDFRQVSVVAGVRILDAKVADEIGDEQHGYYLYLVRAQVLESFKGKVGRGQAVEFYAQVEKPLPFRQGEWIVFLEGSNNSLNNKWSLFELENSSVPYSKRFIGKLRKIKSTSER